MGEPENQASPSAVDDAWDKSLRVSVPDRAESTHDSAETPSARLALGTPGPTPIVSTVAEEPALLDEAANEVFVEPDGPPAEGSPLSFVISAAGPSTAARQPASHDMSLFVAGLVAESAPVVTTPADAVMEPVMRGARKRRQWLAASAIAATIVGGAAVGLQLASSDHAPVAATSAAPLAAPSSAPAPVEASSPAPSPVAAAPVEAPSPAPEPSPSPAVPAEVAETVPAAPAPSVDAAPVVKKSSVAASTTRPKKATTAKKSTKRVATKASTKKKSAKKTSTKKPTAKTTAKKRLGRPRS
jgi:hypothetical protein